MESALVDGNDLWAVEEAASAAVDRARHQHTPTLLECQTYRHYGHSKSDPATYRPKEEVERWLARDPLTLTRDRLLVLGASETDVEAVERDARAAMDRAVEDALAGPYPDPETDRATEFAP
jgi:pyruvate dehydrogenase E1 component alpha subunit